MKKLIYGTLFLAIVGICIVACKKEITNQTEDPKVETNKKGENENYEKSNWPISIGITFEPLRIHRATTDRPRDGKNCGCNECFGLCNARARSEERRVGKECRSRWAERHGESKEGRCE